MLRIIAYSITHRNLSVLRIRTVVDNLALDTCGMVGVVLTQHTGVVHGQSEFPCCFAIFASTKTHPIDANGEVMTFIVELMLVIQAVISEVLTVSAISAFAHIGGGQYIGQILLPKKRGVVGSVTPIGPSAQPYIQTIRCINLIIQAEETARAIHIVFEKRTIDFMIGESSARIEQRLVYEGIAFPIGIAAVDVGIDRQFFVRPNVGSPRVNIRMG